MVNTRFTHNLMLTIDQISQITGIRKSTLRYWEKSFDDFLKPARTHSNRREYSIEDLDRIKAIQRSAGARTPYGSRGTHASAGDLFRPREERSGPQSSRQGRPEEPVALSAGAGLVHPVDEPGFAPRE